MGFLEWGVTRYRRKPIEVNAMQFTGQNLVDIKLMLGSLSGKVQRTEKGLMCETLEGPVFLRRGSWIVKGAHKDVWPVRDDVFRETYEKITEEKR